MQLSSCPCDQELGSVLQSTVSGMNYETALGSSFVSRTLLNLKLS